jgi:glycosyltransferase involved in cell wall biosynthesis
LSPECAEAVTQNENQNFRPCAVIPVYDHEHAVGRVVAELARNSLPCILVDDGSGEPCARELRRLAAAMPAVTLIRLPENRGKGAAVTAGLGAAREAGYSHALQVDADGQHSLADVPRFVAAARETPAALICGRPVFDASIPKARRYGRYLTHVLVWLNTLSLEVPDAMCGFRVYPLGPVLELLGRERLGSRMDFDIEILVRLHWRGVRMRWLPTRISYPADGVSHFRMGLDNLLISRLHARLFLGMLARLPQLMGRRLA